MLLLWKRNSVDSYVFIKRTPRSPFLLARRSLHNAYALYSRGGSAICGGSKLEVLAAMLFTTTVAKPLDTLNPQAPCLYPAEHLQMFGNYCGGGGGGGFPICATGAGGGQAFRWLNGSEIDVAEGNYRHCGQAEVAARVALVSAAESAVTLRLTALRQWWSRRGYMGWRLWPTVTATPRIGWRRSGRRCRWWIWRHIRRQWRLFWR